MRSAVLGIKPAGMSHPWDHFLVEFDNAILSLRGKRALDRRRSIPAIGLVVSTFPANAVKLKVRIGNAKAYIFMSTVRIACCKLTQAKGVRVRIRRPVVIATRECLNHQLVLRIHRRRHHDHACRRHRLCITVFHEFTVKAATRIGTHLRF